MVKSTKRQFSAATPIASPAIVTSVRLGEVLRTGGRFEASAYDAEARSARRLVESFPGGFRNLIADGLVSWCSETFRMKRVYVSEQNGIPLFSSSDILNIENTPSAYISRKTIRDFGPITIKKFDVMLSRSGTIGNVGFAGARFEGHCLTEDALRLRCNSPSDAGFVAAFLRSKYGRLQVTRSTYGSVVQHIEPEHLAGILVPKFHAIEQAEIGRKFLDALEARDEALNRLDNARAILLSSIQIGKSLGSNRASTAEVRLSSLRGRFEANYHSTPALDLETEIKTRKDQFTTIGSAALATDVRAVTKFRKEYMLKAMAYLFIQVKAYFRLTPST
ncbi:MULTISPECIES: hypothetical protein [unclassified Mesorhizobium]|uniref:hypothetical protein n=1 Tax=unclassified Mesorhizobium TaxID=325217 RepID=UPI00112E4922|nr:MULTISPECIES: hypothetical protein [unclassified Mesorhizobium]MCA0028280.1 hypothetical protein [Mesorhizobium sp. B263B1A]TPK01355.1 hypothetical protein FJ489_02065 [Mesorhizobium sp. B2-5-12]TPK26818.1 hypothetical protein FJ562_10875 [Mesorhizobium sp. B2-5-6]